eukprot:8810072-Pyramimonas_sp.AAC.1
MSSPATANLHHLHPRVGSRNLRVVHQLLHRALRAAINIQEGAFRSNHRKHKTQASTWTAVGGIQ